MGIQGNSRWISLTFSIENEHLIRNFNKQMITTLNLEQPSSLQPTCSPIQPVIVFFESPGIIAKSFVQICSYFLGKLASRRLQDEGKWHKANINMLKGEKGKKGKSWRGKKKKFLFVFMYFFPLCAPVIVI